MGLTFKRDDTLTNLFDRLAVLPNDPKKSSAQKDTADSEKKRK